MYGGRVGFLDGVRGAAILSVLLVHCFRFEPTSTGSRLTNTLLQTGWVGVDLFFVLSGYLITGILLRTKSDPHYFRNFYVRRALRIFPAYYFYLLLIFLVLPAAWAELPPVPAESAWFLIYLQNIVVAHNGAWLAWPGAAHLWSVAVEEQFYLVWPFVVWFFSASALRLVCLLLIAAAVLLKLALVSGDAWWFSVYSLPWTRMDALASGALIAVLPHCGRELRLYRSAALLLLALSGASLLFLAGLHGGLHLGERAPVALYTMLTTVLCGAGLLALLTETDQSLPRKLFDSALLRWLGKYSYGLYLLHYGVLHVLDPLIKHQLKTVLSPQLAALAFGLSVVTVSITLAILMYHLLEEPMLRLKDRFAAEAARLPQ